MFPSRRLFPIGDDQALCVAGFAAAIDFVASMPGSKSRYSGGRGLLSEDFGPRIFALGAYVGEILRRKNGGRWVGNDTDPSAAINLALEVKPGAPVWPVQRVLKRFKNGAEDGIYAYGMVIATL